MPPKTKGVSNPSGTNGPKRKRVVTTAQDRENARLKAEEARWRAAKTPEAKAWINHTRLLKEFSTSGEDVLALKVAAATRRDMWAKGDAMGLQVEMFDAQSRPDGPPEFWIVLGQQNAGMSVAGKVRDIQRQKKRQLQEAQHEEAEADAAADEEPTRVDNIDPSLRELRAPVAQMLPGIQEWNESSNQVSTELPPVDQTLGASVAHDESHHSSTNGGAATESRRPRDEVDRDQTTLDVANNEYLESSELLPGEVADHLRQSDDHIAQAQEQLPMPSDHTDNNRIANWVQQQSQTFGSEKPAENLDSTGKWTITCPAIIEQIGSSENNLTMNIYITKTRPHSDNDTDDGNDDIEAAFLDNLDDKEVSESELTDAQRSRLQTYQMWATFEMGLYQGIIRFMAPTVRSGNQVRRSDFDLLPDQLPSLSNRTFQYKWRGRETTDSEISVEAEKATQWIKFEEDGVKLSGVFESEYLGETAFEGAKAGYCEPARLHLGRLWSEVSPKAHEHEAQQKQ